MINFVDNKTLYHIHEDASDLCEHAREAQANRFYDWPGELSFSSSWLGREDLASLDDAIKALGCDWKEGLDTYQSLMDEVDQLGQLVAPTSIRRKARWSDDHGDDVCIDRLRAGQGRYWRQIHRAQRTGPTEFVICCNVATHCGSDPKAVLWRAVASAVLADKLEAAGYRCSVHCMMHSLNPFQYDRTGGPPVSQLLVSTEVKPMGMPLNASALINVLSGWCFRTVLFAAMTSNKGANNKALCASITLGRPWQLNDTLIEKAGITINEHVTGIIQIDTDVRSREEAIQCVGESFEMTNESAFV